MRVKDIKEKWSWGPIPGWYFYAADWILAFPMFEERYKGHTFGEGMILFNNGRMVYITETEEITRHGIRVFKEFMLDPKGRETVRKAWRNAKERLFELDETSPEPKSMSDTVFAEHLREHQKRLNEFWASIFHPELGNFGSPTYLKEKLDLPEEELDGVMEVLTAPEELTFYQQEEIELAETDDVETHARKYRWLKNGYGGVQELDTDFFVERKKDIPADIRKRLDRKIENARKRKEEAREKYGLSREVMDIAEAICTGIIWQDRRKMETLIDFWYKERELKEAARRIGAEPEALKHFDHFEIASFLEGKEFKPRDTFGFRFPGRKVMDREEALEEWEAFHAADDDDVKEFKGIVANKGYAKGKARIILDPHDANFEEGDVLVAPMTSPDYVFAMKKAAAIITDTGGLTSHAAIVSRELGKPCIIGTKIATKTLKDREIVEVDADKGIVRRIA